MKPTAAAQLVPQVRTCLELGLAWLAAAAPTEPSLLNGQLGLATLYAYAYRLLGEDAYWRLAEQKLAAVMEALQHSVARQRPDTSTMASLGQLLPILQQDKIADLALGEASWQLFDELIFDQALTQLQNKNTDFLAGATGALHYLCTRLAGSPRIAGFLEVLLNELLATQIRDATGIRFANSHIERLNDTRAINMGFAHGHWGLLMVLLQVHEAGQHRAQTGPLVEGMLAYVLGYQRPATIPLASGSLFPHNTPSGLPAASGKELQYNNFMGWCYGDLTAALTLYNAHQVLGRADLQRRAATTGARACRVPAGHLQTMSTNFCHGSASLVSCYRALGSVHARPCYARARLAWLAYTVDHVQQELLVPADQSAGSLLNGMAGTLLTLLSELPEASTSWQALFLLQRPPAAQSALALL